MLSFDNDKEGNDPIHSSASRRESHFKCNLLSNINPKWNLLPQVLINTMSISIIFKNMIIGVMVTLPLENMMLTQADINFFLYIWNE